MKADASVDGSMGSPDMHKVILVNGPDLHPDAVRMIAEKGFEVVYTPAYADPDVINAALRETGAVGMVSRLGRISAEALRDAPALRVISKHGAGVDNIDVVGASALDIAVLAASGANAVSVAEHAIALLLATVKRIVPLDAGLRAGRWEKPGFLGRELAGSTIAFIGMGAIAQATARMAGGFGLKAVGYDPFASDMDFEAVGATRVASVEDALSGADVVSLHCPLTPETSRLLNAERIALMRPGSYVVNTARGGLIDEDALLDAIRSGQLAGAGLDTFAVEPPAADHPFWAEPNIVVSPHIGGVTREAGARVGTEAVRGIFQILDGEPIAARRVVNRTALKTPPHMLETKENRS